MRSVRGAVEQGITTGVYWNQASTQPQSIEAAFRDAEHPHPGRQLRSRPAWGTAPDFREGEINRFFRIRERVPLHQGEQQTAERSDAGCDLLPTRSRQGLQRRNTLV